MATDIPRDDAEAALAARRDLGKDYEPAIVESFVEQLDEIIKKRVAEEVEQRGESAKLAKEQRKAESERSGQSLALAIVSMALAIPLTAIASEMSTAMVALVWVAIVLINITFTIGRRLR